MYFFSESLGKLLGLKEGEPTEVHEGLIRMIQAAYNNLIKVITQAHLMKYDKREMLAEFFRASKNRIKTLHLHNNDGIGKDQHILLGLRPNAEGKIGNTKVNRTLLQEHEEILLEMLPILEIKKQDNWNLVTETDKPYNATSLAASFRLLYDHF